MSESFLIRKAKMAFWLFGPAHMNDPQGVYKWLSELLYDGAPLVIAEESLWVEKFPDPEEYLKHTTEEICAMLARSGFNKTATHVDGPYFRLWRAQKSSSSAHRYFDAIQILLSKGDWNRALKKLNQMEEHLFDLPSIKEYLLLMAAAYDLKGNLNYAVQTLNEVLRIDPLCARAMCGFGRIAALKGDLKNAYLWFATALEHQPYLVSALLGQSAVYELTGQIEKAYKNMKLASNMRSHDENLLFEVIRLGNLAGQTDDVADYLIKRNYSDLSTETKTADSFTAPYGSTTGTKYLSTSQQ
jgi:tetratricopeptide (TPR) repeat protein